MTAFQPRPYQAEAIDLAVKELKASIEPFIIEAATGAGKSIIIAEIARIIHEMTGKRILCTAPTAELVIQNRAKYLATGNPASMFSASAGPKSLRHPVIFGSPLTIKGRISAFQNGFALVVIDECDLITPTLRSIIDAMRDANPNLRVIGLTATPYRMGMGYIFREWPDGSLNGEDKANSPYFAKCIYQIQAPELIRQGFLTPPVMGSINTESYDTQGLLPNKQGRFDSSQVDRAYHGHGRKTALICHDIVNQARDRRGVLIYAATIQHAQEIMASLPPELSAIITGNTKDREAILKRFSAQKVKYVVNVGVLTVGVDLPHVDVIAVLRKTESVRLLQQIIGRGLRLYPDKKDCLYLDYTDNRECHYPDGDLFAPRVKAKSAATPGQPIEVECPDCSYINEFSLQPDYAEYARDKHGYALDVFGDPVMSEYGPVPVHWGRRCFGMVPSGVERGKFDRCGYRWSGKDCPACGEKNDLSARYCYDCRAEIIDPNRLLVAEFKAMKRDPTTPQTDKVISLEAREGMSRNGNETLRIDFVTPWRQFSIWLLPQSKSGRGAMDYAKWVDTGGNPSTVSYVKEADSGFFRVLAYNRPADDEELPEQVSGEIEKLKRRAA